MHKQSYTFLRTYGLTRSGVEGERKKAKEKNKKRKIK